MPSLKFETVDAFTSTAFSGNPAAVIVLSKQESKQLDAKQMQLVAREFNLSETAFVSAQDDEVEVKDGQVNYLIRWFTPGAEVPLCGHATLASSHVLFNRIHPTGLTQINFSTLYSGPLVIKKAENNRIELNFPADTSCHSRKVEKGSERWNIVAESLGKATGRDVRGLIREICDAVPGVLIEVATDAFDLEKEKIDPSAFTKEVSGHLVIVTQPSPQGSTHQVSSRVFGPLLGVGEDPVTGVAHTVVGPYWLSSSAEPHSRLLAAQGRSSWQEKVLICKQVSERGGVMEVRWDEKAPERISLIGSAVTVMRGELVY